MKKSIKVLLVISFAIFMAISCSGENKTGGNGGGVTIDSQYHGTYKDAANQTLVANSDGITLATSGVSATYETSKMTVSSSTYTWDSGIGVTAEFEFAADRV